MAQDDDKQIRYRLFGDIELVAVHRIKVGGTGEEVAEWFAKELGWSMPYTFFVRRDGGIFQTRPLDEIAPHAMNKWNRKALSVGVHGDFQEGEDEPLAVQVEALEKLLPELGLMLYGHAAPVVFGHDQLPDSSSDPDKVCPGPQLGLSGILKTARRQVAHDAIARLKYAGMIFPDNIER